MTALITYPRVRRNRRPQWGRKNPALCISLYVNIFSSPLDQGLAGSLPARSAMPGKDYVLHTARPVGKDRSSLVVLPSVNRRLEGRAVFHPLYKDPTAPGVALERTHEHVVRWFRLLQTPIMTLR